MNHFNTQVAEFMKLVDQPILPYPNVPSQDRVKLRINLIEEELKELDEANNVCDLVEFVDALCDIQYVLSGAMLEFGMGASFNVFNKAIENSKNKKVSVKSSNTGLDIDFLYHVRDILYNPVSSLNEGHSESNAHSDDLLDAYALLVDGMEKLQMMPTSEEKILAEFSTPEPMIDLSFLQQMWEQLKQAIETKNVDLIMAGFNAFQTSLFHTVSYYGMWGKFVLMFDEVHRSNMSKFGTLDDAVDTVKDLKVKNPDETYDLVQRQDKWFIYRASDKKLIKPKTYSPANLKQFL